MFDDLHVNHLKTSNARRHDRTTFYDTRNNLRVVARHLPRSYHVAYWSDWLERYAWLAEHYGHERAYRRGLWAGRLRSLLERPCYRNRRLPPAALEHFFCWDSIESHMKELVASGVERVVFADLGKNVFAFYRAARAVGLDLIAIGDDRFTSPGRRYRGVPVVPLDEALGLESDAIVVANTSAVHGTYTCRRVLDRLASAQTPKDASGRQLHVHYWFGPRGEPPGADSDSPESAGSADKRQTNVGQAFQPVS